MSLNKLPDGSDSPDYDCTAVSMSGEEKTVTLREWWYEGKQIRSIEKDAEDYFYSAFDKEPFKIIGIVKVDES